MQSPGQGGGAAKTILLIVTISWSSGTPAPLATRARQTWHPLCGLCGPAIFSRAAGNIGAGAHSPASEKAVGKCLDCLASAMLEENALTMGICLPQDRGWRMPWLLLFANPSQAGWVLQLPMLTNVSKGLEECYYNHWCSLAPAREQGITAAASTLWPWQGSETVSWPLTPSWLSEAVGGCCARIYHQHYGIGGEHTNGIHQYFHLWRALPTAPCPSSRFPQARKWIFFIYSWGTFQISAFSPDPRVRETAHELFNKRICFYSILHPLDISPIDFLSQTFLGASISDVDPKGSGVWFGGPIPHSAGRSARHVRSLFTLHRGTGVGFLVELCLYLSYSSQCSSPFILLWRSSWISFQREMISM